VFSWCRCLGGVLGGGCSRHLLGANGFETVYINGIATFKDLQKSVGCCIVDNLFQRVSHVISNQIKRSCFF